MLFCPVCGTPQGAPPSPPPFMPVAAPASAYPPYPGYMPYPYYPLPPSRDNTALVLVVVIIVILVPVALGALLYLALAPGIVVVPPPTKPVVTFAVPTAIPGGEQLTIASVSSAVSPANYKLSLGVGGEVGFVTTAPLGSGLIYQVFVQVGLSSYSIEWTDIGGEGTLSAGDQYLVTLANGTWQSETTMTFYLVWSDGSQIASVSWQTPPRPLVSFAAASPAGYGWQLAVAAASQAAGPANYAVSLAWNGSLGSAVPMPTTGGGSVVLNIGSEYYRVNWTDIGGERTLNAGDSFTVTQTDVTGTSYMGLRAASQFIFYLLWWDGSQIASVNWVTP